MKILESLGIWETYLSITKTMYSKSIATLYLTEKIPKHLYYNQKWGKDIHSLSLNTDLDVLVRAIKQVKEIKWVRKVMEEVHLHLALLNTIKKS